MRRLRTVLIAFIGTLVLAAPVVLLGSGVDPAPRPAPVGAEPDGGEAGGSAHPGRTTKVRTWEETAAAAGTPVDPGLRNPESGQ